VPRLRLCEEGEDFVKVRAVRRNSGFTLVELTVVLLILVALAGILIPQVSGYVERSHASSVSTNIGEINKFVQLHQAKYLGLGYGSRFDTLLNSAGTGPFDGMDAGLFGANAAATEPLFVGAIQTQHEDALVNAGVAQVMPMADASPNGDVTFAPYAAIPGVPVATTTLTNAVYLTDVQGQTLGLLGAAANEQYIVLGLGTQNSLVGKVMTEAPVHFDAVDPKTAYSRFLLVFAVPTTQAIFDGGFAKARFVTSLGSEGDGLGAHIQTYYSKDAE
jgi:prepilin-type N-terminal cleavage/methylation domain-containing protein